MTTLNNTVQLIGRAGLDPEIKNFENSRKRARFSIAINNYYYNQHGDRVENTQWHQVIAWGKTAEVVEKIVKKGRQLAVTGKLTSQSWEDQDGNKHQKTEIVLNKIQAFGKMAG
ncbi:MAG TPA: single-stranded DNA-binding protein [Bacteroidales bacterium]|jgi:single-strand DNA-binding protein|nr:single-stranded DNA-binding protein [Bacteroidales bacterium]MDD4086496.1 single-stranded DNA-binding protein [Bacteroidales bacterium]MDY0086679.1 single-stranded DNA-binding protein [Bacteroidales bacterium]HPE42981.1 single-stranded DNA-binding protein [Bacteroidales bacterium]